jgi:hypothetical protein
VKQIIFSDPFIIFLQKYFSFLIETKAGLDNFCFMLFRNLT